MEGGVTWIDMLVHGGRVSAEWQVDAWQRTQRLGDPAKLEVMLSRAWLNGRDAGAPDTLPEHWYYQEIANRMRQRARKAGVIAYDGKPRRWRFV